MKSIIATFVAVCFYSSPSWAGVENILSLQREASGTFSVVCDTKGVVSHNIGVTADVIRSDSVCGEELHVALLEEGLYKTNGDFCSQTVKWNGEQLNLVLGSPCTGTVVMEKFDNSWYRGKLTGYEYIYEVEVKSNTAYVFYSRSFGTQADFIKSLASLVPDIVRKAKRDADPTRH